MARSRSPSRTLLAILIAVSVMLSFFHDRLTAAKTHDGSPAISTITMANASSGTPLQHAPGQDDHCLTHLNSFSSQARVPVPAIFAEPAYVVRDETVPPPTGGLAPFKPPCA